MDYASDIDSDGTPLRRRRRGGVSFLIIATGTVFLAVAWILAATDPYSEVAQRVLEVRSEGGPIDAKSVPLFELALGEPGAAAPEEVRVIAPPASATAWQPAAEPPAEAADVPDAATASAEASSVGPHAMPDERPFVPPEKFIGPRLPEGPAAEQALAMSRSDRRAVQRRLSLGGHDPGPADGIFGARTREAISAYQRKWGFAETGYLNAPVLASLGERTDEAYREWLAAEAERQRARRASRAMAESEPAAQAPEGEAAGTGGCRRAEDGSVIGHQSFGCDLRGMGEGIGRLITGGLSGSGHGEGFEPMAGMQR